MLREPNEIPPVDQPRNQTAPPSPSSNPWPCTCALVSTGPQPRHTPIRNRLACGTASTQLVEQHVGEKCLETQCPTDASNSVTPNPLGSPVSGEPRHPPCCSPHALTNKQVIHKTCQWTAVALYSLEWQPHPLLWGQDIAKTRVLTWACMGASAR